MVKIREIPGYPGYAASRDGRIWSKKISGSNRIGRKWKVLGGKNNKGYRYVTLYKCGIPYDWAVHQLILLTFVGPLPDGQETRHENGFRDDNRLDNLCYGTRKENAEDCVEHGTQPYGELHGSCKLTNDEVTEIIRLRAEEGVRGCKLAEMFGVSPGLISMILNGQIWTHLPRPESFTRRQKRTGVSFSKITEDDVRKARRMHDEGFLQREIGEELGISQAMISRIVSGKSWPDVK
jgi:predicted transcriptional regulator